MKNEHMCFESFTLRTVELIFLCFIALIKCSRLPVDSSTFGPQSRDILCEFESESVKNKGV